MRQVLNGEGVDTTAQVAAYLESGYEFILANAYLIGDYDDPAASWLTDWEGPLDWPIWGTFEPGVVSRNSVKSKIGLEVEDLEFTWTPPLSEPSASIATANPYQLAQLGYYDNKLFRCWVIFMPSNGDANTYGGAALFGGRIAKSEIKRGKITFTVNSFLDVVNEMVPTNVIEITNTAAGYAGATPPPGHTKVPQFAVEAGSTPGTILANETSPNANHIFADGAMRGWFLVFNGGTGATLARQLGRIVNNTKVGTGLGTHNSIVLYQPLPWAPTPGVDTFYVSASAPINQGEIGGIVIDAAGTSYVPGDIVNISGGSGGQAQVISTGSGGIVTEVELLNPGSGYVATTGAATSGGSGSGLTLTLTIAPYLGFPYVPAPQTGL